MKLILTDYEDHSKVDVQDNGINEHTYTFDDHKQARAFCSGFTCARKCASAVVQSLPMDYEVRKVGAPETIGQQLSHQYVGSV